MMHSEHLDKLAEALAKAQGAIKNPDKNREVSVTSRRTGSTYTFMYATLDNIFDTIRKPMADNGLSFTQSLYTNGDGKLRLVTMVLHQSGQWLKTETPVTVAEGDNGMQALGSAQTYARRYAISSLLGIAAEEDDDANAADGNTVNGKTDKPKGRTAAPRQTEDPAVAKSREDFMRIREAINLSKTPEEIDRVIKAQGKTLESIKAVSQTGYEQLMAFAEERKTSILQQAA